MTEREAAWDAVPDAVVRLPGWALGPAIYHADGDRWNIAAIDVAARGRRAHRETLEATGSTEIEALRALVGLLEDRQVCGG